MQRIVNESMLIISITNLLHKTVEGNVFIKQKANAKLGNNRGT